MFIVLLSYIIQLNFQLRSILQADLLLKSISQVKQIQKSMENMENVNATSNKLARTKRIDFGIGSNIQSAKKKTTVSKKKSSLFNPSSQSEEQQSSENPCEASSFLDLKGPIFNFTPEYLNKNNKNTDFDKSQQLKSDESKIKYTFEYPQNIKKLACMNVEMARIDKGYLLEDLLAVIVYNQKEQYYSFCFMMKKTHNIIYHDLILPNKSSIKQSEKFLLITTFGVKTSQQNVKRLQLRHLKLKRMAKNEDYDHFIQTLSKIIAGTHKCEDIK